ncbi:MAG TPA: HAMP domain-containing histidine kinase, partial [Armatimonadetes bacterium]|nr:HAMP domain-containing histidine kinase [Armatimonadota bacterium]
AKVAFLLKMLDAMCAGIAPQAGTIPIEDMQMLTDVVRLSEVYQQQMERIQSIFLALVSHELRTPLTPILVYARLLEAEQLGPLTEAQREAKEVIREQTRRLVRMVDNTLDLCAIHAGMPPKLQFSRQPLNELLAMAIQEVTPAATRRKIQLRAAEGAKLTPVHGDARRLLRALINVLDGLVKVMPEGGKLHVQTHRDADRNEIRIFAEGAVLTQDEVTKIFDPFYQLDSRLAREHGGIGLGLAVAQHIIESHDGCVSISALPTQGCVCTITLPALRDNDAS